MLREKEAQLLKRIETQRLENGELRERVVLLRNELSQRRERQRQAATTWHFAPLRGGAGAALKMPLEDDPVAHGVDTHPVRVNTAAAAEAKKGDMAMRARARAHHEATAEAAWERYEQRRETWTELHTWGDVGEYDKDTDPWGFLHR